MHLFKLLILCTASLDDGAKGIVEMLFCTSLIALVGAADQPQSSPRKLQIVNTKVCPRPYLRTLYASPLLSWVARHRRWMCEHCGTFPG